MTAMHAHDSRQPATSARPVAVITGASGGIGEALARRIAPSYALSLIARRAPVLHQLADDLTASTGTEVLTVVADVTMRADVQRIVQDTRARFGRIDAPRCRPPTRGFRSHWSPPAWTRSARYGTDCPRTAESGGTGVAIVPGTAASNDPFSPRGGPRNGSHTPSAVSRIS
jgi:hypothetical protein